MMHKQLLLALMAAYPVQYFLTATIVVVVTVWFCIHSKNKFVKTAITEKKER